MRTIEEIRNLSDEEVEDLIQDLRKQFLIAATGYIAFKIAATMIIIRLARYARKGE